MALTFLQVINRVLAVVGEDEVSEGTTELATDYHKKIAAFVNLIKEEVEDAHNWRALQTTTTITGVVAGTQNIVLTGTNERTRVVRWHDQRHDRVLPMVFAYTPTQGTPAKRLLEIDNSHARSMTLESPDDEGDPVWFSIIEAASGSSELRMSVVPKLAETTDFRLNLIVPQDHIANDELDTVIKIPARPLIVGSIWYALEDRGEELGPNGMFTEERFRKALDDAIARDSAEQGDYAELVRV